MRPFSVMVIGGLMSLAWASAHAADGQKVFTQGGADPAALACIGCHGADGNGIGAAGFPRLAGLPAPYLSKQLRDWRNGTRQQAVMTPLAKALSEDEITAVSAYLASLPAPATGDLRRQQIANDPTLRLALYGDWNRHVPGCIQCHGPGGGGVGEHFPPLSGQPAAYLAAQLNAWRDGTRSNDPNQLMVGVAKAMTPDEITAVSAFFALPANLEAKP